MSGRREFVKRLLLQNNLKTFRRDKSQHCFANTCAIGRGNLSNLGQCLKPIRRPQFVNKKDLPVV